MISRFTAGWLVAAAVCSSWAISTASDRAPERQAASAERPSPVLPPLSAGLEAEIALLAARSRARANAGMPSRNLFEFGDLDVAAKAREGRAVMVDAEPGDAIPAPVPAPDPVPSLSAIAQMGGVATAVISFRDTLHYVKEGDVIAGRYRVDAVSAQWAELFDLTAGTILRLSLQTVT